MREKRIEEIPCPEKDIPENHTKYCYTRDISEVEMRGAKHGAGKTDCKHA